MKLVFLCCVVLGAVGTYLSRVGATASFLPLNGIGLSVGWYTAHYPETDEMHEYKSYNITLVLITYVLHIQWTKVVNSQ